jgi:hypothetical protein
MARLSSMTRLVLAGLSFFGPKCSCEQLFSTKKYVKSDFKNRPTDEESADFVALKTTTYRPIIADQSSNA